MLTDNSMKCVDTYNLKEKIFFGAIFRSKWLLIEQNVVNLHPESYK